MNCPRKSARRAFELPNGFGLGEMAMGMRGPPPSDASLSQWSGPSHGSSGSAAPSWTTSAAAGAATPFQDRFAKPQPARSATRVQQPPGGASSFAFG